MHIKDIILSCFLLFLICGCKRQMDHPQRIKIKCQPVSDEVMTTMPGSLIVCRDYLVWTDPFAHDYFVHVHDKSSGEPIGVMGKVGKGPEEFISGGISQYCINNKFYANDPNSNTRGYLSIDSLIRHKNPFVRLVGTEKEKEGFNQLSNNVYVGYTENGDKDYFNAIINGSRSTFGKYPILESKRHIGLGSAYDSISGMFVYAPFSIPYMALYKRIDNTFILQWERKSDKKNYEIVDGKIIFDRTIQGASEICMTKDYIVTLERDRENDPIDESSVGRDASKCPQTVFLYDFDSRLIKIVDLGLPVMRIAADRSSNTLYAIGVNPEFQIVKCEL